MQFTFYVHGERNLNKLFMVIQEKQEKREND